MAIIRLSAVLLSLLPGLALAQAPTADCTLARDPERCLMRETALAMCADVRGKAKRACLDEHLPPIECSKTQNPARCEATEQAKKKCAGKDGKTLKACLRGEAPKKAKSKPAKKPKRAKKPAKH